MALSDVVRPERATPLPSEEYRLLVESVVDYAIFMLDEAGNVATWNAGAERAKGYAADEIIGRHFSAFYTPEERASASSRSGLPAAMSSGG